MCRRKKNIDYCRLYRGEEKNPFENTRTLQERFWNEEKEVCENEECARDASEFVFFVAMRLKHCPKSYIARYIAEYDDCSVDWKKSIAKISEVEDVLLFQKPKGRTVFEKMYGGPICNEGYLLYANGRIYSYYGKTFKRESECFVLEQENKGLVQELKEYSLTVCDKFKKKCKKTMLIPPGTPCYKFFSNRFYVESLNDENYKLIQHVENLFHWYAMPLERMDIESVEEFTSCWRTFMEGMIGPARNERIFALISKESFPNDCWALGFEMDCFESFDKKYGSACERFENRPLEKAFQIVDDYKILGNAIFSQWRYYNHWAFDPIAEFDPEWFILAFNRLEELYKKSLAQK